MTDLASFERIVTSFVDDYDFRRGILIMERGDELVEVSVTATPKGITVTRDGGALPATEWIYKDLAKLELLARRIVDLVHPPEHFVSPRGKLVDGVDVDPDGTERTIDDACGTLRNVLGRPLAGTTSVLYLTSEAGEGKTSLIEQVAVQQAEAYLKKKADWLLLPVPLGGRPFLRLDDAIVAAYVNRLKFPYWYYGGFIELVRLGAIVPAFDGFEDMIADSRSQAARSAFKHLIGELESQGSILVAARRAFVDLSFGSQADLWKAESPGQDVQLRRLALNRWDKSVFLRYARKRQVILPEALYEDVTEQLRTPKHPVLTRAVLVRRLIDVALEENDLSAFLARISEDQTNYFYEFVESIVRREVEYKWHDLSGDKNARLLSLEQHHQLLSMLAGEMWLCSVEMLGREMLDMVVEIFAEDQDLPPSVAWQVRERIGDHALLHVQRENRRDTVEFDHDDFRLFYLGQTLGHALVNADATSVEQILDTKTLTAPAIAEATRLVRQARPTAAREVLDLLDETLKYASQVSYLRENAGMLLLSLLDNLGIGHTIRRGTFGLDSLAGRSFSGLVVKDSSFAATRLKDTQLHRCTFSRCRFERLVIDEPRDIQHTELNECQLDSIAIGQSGGEMRSYFDTADIRWQLNHHGFSLGAQGQDEDAAETPSGTISSWI
ncbi:MAG: hypothetical protein OXU68_07605 [Bacteroidota bacterium]|nr:hypothetical protein [Bacteroidota bacterium]